MEKMSGKCCIHIGRWVCSTVLVMSMVACDDALDNKTPDVPSEKGVPVELSFGFANEEDGYTLSGSGNTRSENALQEGGFSAQLIPNANTRATADLKPDALYELHVLQYKQNGTLIKMNYKDGATVTGAKLTYNLVQADDCQLVIVARGKGNAFPVIDSHLADVQKLTMDKTIFENIPTSGATQDQINKMPYVLHLEHVNVTSDGKLQSIEGAHDARLLLKRLATKLTVNWNLSDALTTDGYALKEVKLCQVPAKFSVIPTKEKTSEWGVTYPSSVAEFIDYYRLTDTELANAKGTRNVWIPANVRGSSPKATSPYYRTKGNAPVASSYVELVVDNSVKQERLYYRAYLGGEESTDYNLYENKNYNWMIKVSSANYRDDGRIQLLDQTPVESTNLVPTLNCFMMIPGTNICFNPYKHEAGTNGWNDQLVNNPNGSATVKIPITTVKVLWQTKDVGTSGDLVMGYVIDDTNHKNLVNIANANDMNNARVSVKVPVTQGGNAVIAAYAVDGTTILWSWHIWVTDYVPIPISNYAEYGVAQKNSKNGTVHKWDSPLFAVGGVYEKKVMMDRELGAKKGGFPGFTIGDGFTIQDVVNTYGMLYQWGRKDPFFPSADGTNNEIDVIFDGYGMAVGIDKVSGQASIETAIQNPKTFYRTNTDWCLTAPSNRWNGNTSSSIYAPGVKTIYDPCPYGWKIPMAFRVSQDRSATNIDTNSIYTHFGRLKNGNPYYNFGNFSGGVLAGSDLDKFLFYRFNEWVGLSEEITQGNPKGGSLFLIGDVTTSTGTIYNTVWFPTTSERYQDTGDLLRSGTMSHMWTADWFTYDNSQHGGFMARVLNGIEIRGFNPAIGWPVRCIQDN